MLCCCCESWYHYTFILFLVCPSECFVIAKVFNVVLQLHLLHLLLLSFSTVEFDTVDWHNRFADLIGFLFVLACCFFYFIVSKVFDEFLLVLTAESCCKGLVFQLVIQRHFINQNCITFFNVADRLVFNFSTCVAVVAILNCHCVFVNFWLGDWIAIIVQWLLFQNVNSTYITLAAACCSGISL